MMMLPPQNLPNTVDNAYKAVNPNRALVRGDRDPQYVDCSAARSGRDEMRRIFNRIERSSAPFYSKQLFTGHSGCGKSTELFRLKRMLEDDEYFVVYFDVDLELEISDLDYPDVLLTIAQQVEAQLRERALIELDHNLLEEVARWFGTTVLTEQQGREINTTLETEFGLGIKLPYLVFAKMLAAFKGEIKNSSQRRVEIRRVLERNATGLITRVNDLIDNARSRLQQHDKRGLVLIVDGLERLLYRIDDKTGQSTHDLVFIMHGEQLRSPNCHLVYTFPINLLLKQNVGKLFPESTILPMVKIAEEHGSPCDAGIEALRQIIHQRLDVTAIFDPPRLIDDLVKMSGGHVRDLLRLVGYSFDETDSTVNSRCVQQAMRELANEYDYLIEDAALPLLYAVHQTHRVPNDDKHALLLYNLLVLEYRNGEKWWDIHPAVRAARKFREYVSKVEAKRARPKRKKK